LFSANKGKTWSSPPVGESPKNNCTRYLINSSAKLLCSSDNITWGTQETLKGARLRAVASLDPKRAYAVGDGGLVLRSVDSGKTWENQSKAERGGLLSLWALSEKELFAVGQGGKILYSNDAGASWSAQASSVKTTLRAIWGAGASLLFVAGDAGVVLRSVDAGKTWTQLDTGTKENLRAIWGNSAEVYIVGDKSTLLVSYNNGDVWSSLFAAQKDSLYGIYGPNENDLFIVGASGTNGLILHSTDGAKTWVSSTFANPNRIDAIWGDGNKNYFALGQGLLLRSQDNGATWNQQISTLSQGASLSSGDAFVDIWGDVRELFLLSASGSLLRSTNQGKTWSLEALPFGVSASRLLGLGSALLLVGSAGSFEVVLKATR
jgi:photosystem II stability/assembly factor-like uncharacterized protein